MPDEVWNFRRGDGIEKAILLADYIIQKDNAATITININYGKVLLSHKNKVFEFSSQKSFTKTIRSAFL